jgi:hypothetical protein
MADEIIEKAGEVLSGYVGGPGANLANSMATSSGLLNAEQANQFIDYMWDATTLAKDGRRITMRANEVDIDAVAVGERVIRRATEADGTYENAPVSFSKITITTNKIRLDWEVSRETNEDSIEGDGTSGHIARLFATQAGNDIEDLAINGVYAAGSGGTPGLNILDGFYKQGVTDGLAHVIDWNEAVIGRSVFDRALKALPRKYKANRSALRFYTGSGLVQDYLTSLTGVVNGEQTVETITADVLRGSLSGPQGPGGGTYPLAFGVPIVEVPLFNEDTASSAVGDADTLGHVELTTPGNRIWGVKRDIEFYDEFKKKKDTTEYTMFMRFGIQVQNWDAYVVVKDVLVKGSGAV